MNDEFKATVSQFIVHRSSFIVHHFVLSRLFERGAFVVRGDAVVFVSPVAEVEQFAAFGAEWAIRIVLPLDGLVACRTLLHKALTTGKGEGTKGKGKSGV
jgi:hypothetical protein